MSKVYKFRVLLDHEDEGIFRDIEVCSNQNFDVLHNAILKAFKFKGKQMASFYMSNDNWEKEDEVALADVSDKEHDVPLMDETKIEEFVEKEGEKIIYVFDFLLMWSFHIELLKITKPVKGVKYPRCVYECGKAPTQNSKKITKEKEDDDETIMNEISNNESEFKEVFKDEMFDDVDDFDNISNLDDDLDTYQKN